MLTANGNGGAAFADLPAALAATSANTPGTLVQRDGSGNFAAGTITATLNGDAASMDGKSASELCV